MIPPCYKCEERHIGCHATCKGYLEFCEARGKALERQQADREARDISFESVMRWKKIRKREKK